MPHGNAPQAQLLAIDLARSGAPAGMVAFHLVRDLKISAFIPAGTTLAGGWAIFALIIAGSFIFLSGVSLVLSHGAGFRVRSWARRSATS